MPSPFTPTEDDAAFYRAALNELIALGTDLARDIHAARRTEPPAITPAEAADAFERVARATRRTIHLAARLDGLAPARPGTHPLPAARKHVIRAVEDAITRESGADTDTRARLESEFHERLDSEEFVDDLAHRAPAEIVADILRDMDLGRLPGARRHWRRRTPPDLRRLHALAHGAPFTAMPGRDPGIHAAPPPPAPHSVPRTKPAPDPVPRTKPAQGPVPQIMPVPVPRPSPDPRAGQGPHPLEPLARHILALATPPQAQAGPRPKAVAERPAPCCKPP